MTEKAYFISDLHLGSLEEPNVFVLLKFLKTIQSKTQASHLFLLGDIFDLWVADHNYFKVKFAPILQELSRLHQVGVEIHYFEGNHDLYLQHYFAEKLGFNVHRQAAYFRILGRDIRVEHGDQMDPSDKGYIFLRRFLRTDLMEWLAPRLPEWFVVRLGERMSRVSRKYTSHVKVVSDVRARQVMRDHALRAWRERRFDLILSGHVHVTEDTTLNVREIDAKTSGREDETSAISDSERSEFIRVVNLGAWFERPRVFVISSDFIGFREL